MSFNELLKLDEKDIDAKVSDIRTDLLDRRLNQKSEEKDTSVFKKKRKELARLLTARNQQRSK